MTKRSELAGLACLAIVVALCLIPLASPVSRCGANGGATGSFNVTDAIIAFSPKTGLSFTYTQGGSPPPGQILRIWNSGTGTITWNSSNVTYNPDIGIEWLSQNITSGVSTYPANETYNATAVNISVNITNLAVGKYNATITITAPEAINSAQVPVTLDIKAGGGPGPGGGGGGGGGGAAPPPLLPLEICTPDGLCCLLIPEGTAGLTAGGATLTEITLNEVAPPANATPGCSFLTRVYGAGPDGATFEPQITILFYYDKDKIPQGMTASELSIVTYNETRGEWVVLKSTVNAIDRTISAELRHFTPFTVLACGPAPPTFVATNLIILPPEVYTGEEVTITVTITNTGELTGRHEVVLNINGEEVRTKEVDLAAGSSQDVTFTVTEDAMGTYHVTIDGQTGKFDVLTLPPSWISQNWWLILLIVIAAGVLAYLLIKPRLKRGPEEEG